MKYKQRIMLKCHVSYTACLAPLLVDLYICRNALLFLFVVNGKRRFYPICVYSEMLRMQQEIQNAPKT